MPRFPRNKITRSDKDTLGKLWRLFIKPFLNHRPAGMGEAAWLEKVFGTNYRNFVKYRVRRPFKMPGLNMTIPKRREPDTGYRHVHTKQVIFMLEDIRAEGKRVVSFLPGGTPEQVYELTEEEWGSILPCLEEACQ